MHTQFAPSEQRSQKIHSKPGSVNSPHRTICFVYVTLVEGKLDPNAACTLLLVYLDRSGLGMKK